MSYEDLPPEIRTLPLTDPQVRADLIDLIVGHDDRLHGCVAIWLCDSERRAQVPVLVAQTGPVTPAKVGRILRPCLRTAMGPILVGVGRPGSPLFTADDIRFAEEVERVCVRAGVECLGAYVATADAVREIPEALRRAS